MSVKRPGALCLLILTAVPAQAALDAQHGKVVFDKWCAPCHGPDPKLAGTTALQAKYDGAVPAALEARSDLTPEIVATFVRNGIAWMAPFRKTEVSDGDLADIGAYLAKPAPRRKGK
jgi:mono/diheme cytochrome c family protein